MLLWRITYNVLRIALIGPVVIIPMVLLVAIVVVFRKTLFA